MMNVLKLTEYEAIPFHYTGIIQKPTGTYWLRDGMRHNLEGPAYIDASKTTRLWWILNYRITEEDCPVLVI